MDDNTSIKLWPTRASPNVTLIPEKGAQLNLGTGQVFSRKPGTHVSKYGVPFHTLHLAHPGSGHEASMFT